ncbi:hypothetical protein HanIR_Chr09g0424581 [Helianthus annuus]|nr:hypothetical protein HanIR_Chr09g0424581 [Helianthus annuus]
MLKPKSIKNHPHFVLLFNLKTPQKSLFTPSTYIPLSITLVSALNPMFYDNQSVPYQDPHIYTLTSVCPVVGISTVPVGGART